MFMYMYMHMFSYMLYYAMFRVYGYITWLGYELRCHTPGLFRVCRENNGLLTHSLRAPALSTVGAAPAP